MLTGFLLVVVAQRRRRPLLERGFRSLPDASPGLFARKWLRAKVARERRQPLRGQRGLRSDLGSNFHGVVLFASGVKWKCLRGAFDADVRFWRLFVFPSMNFAAPRLVCYPSYRQARWRDASLWRSAGLIEEFGFSRLLGRERPKIGYDLKCDYTEVMTRGGLLD